MTDKAVPYIFHMNWNTNTDTKQKFLEQMGAWRVREGCVSGSGCCVQAKPVCHYRDKPSKLKTCARYPAIDNGASFW